MRGLWLIGVIALLAAPVRAERIADDTPTLAQLADRMQARAERLRTVAYRGTSQVAGHLGLDMTRFGDQFEYAVAGARYRYSEPDAQHAALIRGFDGSRYVRFSYDEQAVNVYLCEGGPMTEKAAPLLDNQRTLLTLDVAQRPPWDLLRRADYFDVRPQYAVVGDYQRLLVVCCGDNAGDVTLYFSADHDYALVRVEHVVRPGQVYRDKVLPRGDTVRASLTAVSLVQVDDLFLPEKLEGELSMTAANPRHATRFARGSWTLSDYRLAVDEDDLRIPDLPENARVRREGDLDEQGRLRIYRWRGGKFVPEQLPRVPANR